MITDPAVKDRFIELRAQGLTYDLIAQELNISRRTLIYWSKSLKSQIDPLRAAHLETLLDKYAALKENRIELFGKKLQAILQVLENRPLYDIPTDKAFSLVLKYAAALKKEETDLERSLTAQDDEAGLPDQE
jgi:hypothetical protein